MATATPTIAPTTEASRRAQSAGFEVHFGTPADGDLAGRYWWTLFQRGWSGAECAPGTFSTGDDAWEDAVATLATDPELRPQIEAV